MWESWFVRGKVRRISGPLAKPQVLDERPPASVLMRTHPSWAEPSLQPLQDVPLVALIWFRWLLVANLPTHCLPLPLEGLPWDELPKVPQK